MRKFLLIFLAISIRQTLQQPVDNIMELAKTSVIDCYEDEENTKKIEITDAGFEDLASGSRDVIRNAKCIRYCIMKKHKLFSDDNTLNESAFIPFLVYLFDNSVDKNHIKTIIADCNKVIAEEADRCELSHKANNCILEHLNKSGLKDI
ncbi:general odorant-binding protein 19d-like [Cochliomyia hominivorax]